MANKKTNKCEQCKFYDGINCFHHTNIGIQVQHRLEQDFFVKNINELNKNGNCKNYDRA